jgi:hypothetical protein
VCLLGPVKEVRLPAQRDSPVGERWVGANSIPEFSAVDDDLFPDIAVEHAGALLVHAARCLVDGLEYRSSPISPDASRRIRLAALDRCICNRTPVGVRRTD